MAKKKNGTPKPVGRTGSESSQNCANSQGTGETILEQLQAKIKNGTATEQEHQFFEYVLRMQEELVEYQKENAHIADEIAELEKKNSKCEQELGVAMEILDTVTDAAYTLSEETISIQEKSAVFQGAAFGRSSENARNAGRKDDHFTDRDGLELLTEGETPNTLPPKVQECIDVLEKSRKTYLSMKLGEKENNPVVEELIRQGEFVTAEEIETEAKIEHEFDGAFARSLNGDSNSFINPYAEYDKSIEKLKGIHMIPQTPKSVSGNDDVAQFHKEWVRRQTGDRQKLLGELDYKRVMYDPEGNEVECTEKNVRIPQVDGMIIRFVGFREAYSEVDIVPMQAYVRHVMTPMFKYIPLDAEADIKELQRKLQDQLGDGYVVDGIQREMKGERDAQNAAKRAQLPQNKWFEKNEKAKQKRDEKERKKREEAAKAEESPKGQQEDDNDGKNTAEEPLAEIPVSETEPVQTSNATQTKSKRREIFVKQATPGKLRQNCYAGPVLIALVIFLKFTLGIPINRAVNTGVFASAGLNVSAGVVTYWVNMIFFTKFFYLIPLLRATLMMQKYIHADETTLQVMREPERENTQLSYLWLYSSIAGCPHQVRFYDYAPGRAGLYPVAALADWVGTYLITDAYQGYNKVGNCLHCFCMIHARRKFFSASVASASRVRRAKAARVVRLFDILFAIEAKLQDCSPEERLAQRKLQMEEPLTLLKNLIADYLKDETIAPSSRLHDACKYFTTHQENLLRFMTDGNIPLHNMVAENAIRPIAVGRHSWLFAGSPLGGEVLAGMMTIVQTAIANGLDPFLYVKFVLEHTRGNDFMLDDELMHSLLPWSPEAQAACRRTPKAMPVAEAA